jgi:hypothetical protein
MPTKLHEDAKRRIVEALTDAVPKILVENKMFLDRKSLVWLFIADLALPKHGKIRDQLNATMGDSPLVEFIDGSLSRELFERDEYDSNFPSLRLDQIPGYENPQKVAEQWVADFETLPWSYLLSLQLPVAVSNMLREVVNRVPFGDRVFLVHPFPQFIEQHPLLSGNDKKNKSIHSSGGFLGLLGDPPQPKWDEERVYLQFKVDGFIGRYGGTEATFSGESSLKAFCGLCIALRIFKIQQTYQHSPPKQYVYVHKYSGAGWEIDNRLELDQGIEPAFRDLVVHDLDGALDTDDKKKYWVRSTLPDVQVVFSEPSKAEKILLAAQWLFESYCGRNELLAFVQTMVTLEILLGEQSGSEMGLGELLRNRCAFLISQSHQERSELLVEFNEIYRVRSQIVHRGKSRLNFHERSLFRKLQWICRRVIQEEVKLLKADRENAEREKEKGGLLAAPVPSNDVATN